MNMKKLSLVIQQIKGTLWGEKLNGHVETQTMQTADCADCAD